MSNKEPNSKHCVLHSINLRDTLLEMDAEHLHSWFRSRKYCITWYTWRSIHKFETIILLNWTIWMMKLNQDLYTSWLSVSLFVWVNRLTNNWNRKTNWFYSHWNRKTNRLNSNWNRKNHILNSNWNRKTNGLNSN